MISMNHIQDNIKTTDVAETSVEADIVRATYTMPHVESEAIDGLRKRIAKENGEILNRSEVVRMGLLALQGMSNNKLKNLLAELERCRPGRKKKQEESGES